MEHTVFSTYIRIIEITFVKNKIFYMAVQPGRVVRNKIDIIFVIVLLKTETCSLTFKSASADYQSNKSTALFIWSEFAWGKCHTVFS